jgi:hypothetical protein
MVISCPASDREGCVLRSAYVPYVGEANRERANRERANRERANRERGKKGEAT